MPFLKGKRGQPKAYPGSRRRVRRLSNQATWPPEFWIFVVLVFLALLVAVLWISRNFPEHHRPTGTSIGPKGKM